MFSLNIFNELYPLISQTGCKDTDFFLSSKSFFDFFDFFLKFVVRTLKNARAVNPGYYYLLPILLSI
jgi:hypothetical protein